MPLALEVRRVGDRSGARAREPRQQVEVFLGEASRVLVPDAEHAVEARAQLDRRVHQGGDPLLAHGLVVEQLGSLLQKWPAGAGDVPKSAPARLRRAWLRSGESSRLETARS